MSDRGPHYGERLTAKDVLRLYAAGERDFRGTILRGCNFRGADLSGANFTGADIRSSNFMKAQLRGNNFSKVLAGSTSAWVYCKLIVALFVLILIVCVASIASSSLTKEISIESVLMGLTISPASLLVFLQILICVIIVIGGFTYLSGVAILFSYALAVLCAIAVLFVQQEQIPQENLAAILASFTGAGTITVAWSFIGKILVTFSFYEQRTLSLFSIWLVSWLVLFGRHESMLTFLLCFVYIFSACLIALKELRRLQDPNSNGGINLEFVLYLNASVGGTSFRSADLVGSSFVYGKLAGCDLAGWRNDAINLTHVRWYMATGLDESRFHESRFLRLTCAWKRYVKLLTSLNGVDQDFSDFDLEGVNLAGATLHRICLKGANLNGAILAGAELHGANLTNAQCVGTDFAGAHLTGACLEAWNIDETTVLKDIDCEYVFLKEEPDAKGNQERRPHDPDKVFQPGDFEKFFKEMLDTVQILIRNGVDPRAFQAALEQVMADNPEITRESIQAMEKQGDDVLLTLQVPEGTDKAKVERSWDEGYQLGLEAGYTKGLLQGQTQRAEDVKEVALGFSKFLSSIQITNMNTPINSGDGGFINTGSMEGNIVNLGELSGQVTVQINQLPDAPSSADQPSLKELLTELQAAIEAETELSDVEKKEALGEVGKLAEAGTKPQDNAMQRMAKRAAANLKSITEPLTEASNLVTVCQSLLPLIWAIF